MKANKKTIAVFIMSNVSLDAIVKGYVKLEATYKEQRASAVQQLVYNLPENEASTAANKEYLRRLKYVCNKIAKLRKVKADSIRVAIQRDLDAIGWVAPRAERSESDKAQNKRKADATRKRVDNMAKKMVAEATKHNPKLKVDMKLFKTKAQEKIAEERDSTKEQLKQKSDHSKVFIEKTRRVNMSELPVMIADGKFSNDADYNRKCGEMLAAFINFAAKHKS